MYKMNGWQKNQMCGEWIESKREREVWTVGGDSNQCKTSVRGGGGRKIEKQKLQINIKLILDI